MVGGGAKSGTWRQIMADVTNKAVTTPYMQETGTLGAATLAGVGAGLFKDFTSPETGRYVDSSPRNDAQETYSLLYQKYRRLYKALE